MDFIHKGPWWTNKGMCLYAFLTGILFVYCFLVGILTLNLFLAIPLLTSTINGYDSSVVNGT